MGKFKERLVDILAFPTILYEKLTDRKLTLVLGILLIGAIDLMLPDVVHVYKSIFAQRSVADVRYNAFMIVVVIILLGLVDVVFVGVPLFDIFRLMKKREATLSERYSEQLEEEDKDYNRQKLRLDSLESREYNASAIKVMKVYIMSHFLIIPVNTLLYFILARRITDSSPDWMLNLWLTIFMLILVWAAAIVARGINVLFRFNPVFRRLTFIIVFTWNFVFSIVFNMKIMNWVLQLLR